MARPPEKPTECNTSLSSSQLANLPDSSLSAYSTHSSFPISLSRLNSASSWAALTNDASQWIQVTLSEVKVIVKVATQGRANADQWVTSYKLQTSCGGDLEYILKVRMRLYMYM